MESEEAFRECLDLGAPPQNCDPYAQQVLADCLATECSAVPEIPPCEEDCDDAAEQSLDDCLDQGGDPDDCVDAAHQQFDTCLTTECGFDTPGPSPIYAAFFDLGLEWDDDIDGLVVFDTDGDGVFNGTDEILFSLAPDSPSLLTIPGASAVGAAADIFVARPEQAPAVFASAASLGLGHPDDNIDALDYTLCDDAAACAALRGIRAVIADFNDDGDVDGQDFTVLQQCLTSSLSELPAECIPVDLDVDGDVDCQDWSRFAAAWTDASDPPAVPRCVKGIPAVSGWGAGVMVLFLITVGGIVFPRCHRTGAG